MTCDTGILNKPLVELVDDQPDLTPARDSKAKASSFKLDFDQAFNAPSKGTTVW